MKIWCIMLASVLLVSGCVGLDTAGIRAKGDLPVGHLSREQISGLKSAAAMGEPSLVATAARLAWESPEDAQSLINYAANLFPDRVDDIKAGVAKMMKRQG